MEALHRLNDKARSALAGLPPKVLDLNLDGGTFVVESPTVPACFRDEIKTKRFTGKGDADKVTRSHAEYCERIAEQVTSILHIEVADAEFQAVSPVPNVDQHGAVPEACLRGERYVLCRSVGLRPEPRLCRVTADGAYISWTNKEQEASAHESHPVGVSTISKISIDRLDHQACPWPSEAFLSVLERLVTVAKDKVKASRLDAQSLWATSVHWMAHSDFEQGVLRDLQAAEGCLDRAAPLEIRIRDKREDVTKAKQALTMVERKRELANAEEDLKAKKDLAKAEKDLAEVEKDFTKEMQDFSQHCADALGDLNRVAGKDTADLSKSARAWEYLVHVATILLHLLGGTARCGYKSGLLAVLVDNEWVEAAVEGCSGRIHVLSLQGGSQPLCQAMLHPWNHVPLDLRLSDFEKLRDWWMQKLATEHSYITDAVSGRRLDVMSQCVSITLKRSRGIRSTAPAADSCAVVHEWILMEHARLCGGAQHGVQEPACLLITAGPAAGKTTCTSQLVMLLQKASTLVPILVRGQIWQRRLAESLDVFHSAWNWVDAYVQVEFGKEPAVVRMLRQAMLSRRAVLILDGLDECGAARRKFEEHISHTLVPQGHVIVAFCRPVGLDDASFSKFERAELEPLNDAQQQEVLRQRLSDIAERDKLWAYIGEHMSPDESGTRITSNPLMLSVLVSVAELRLGHAMPRSLADLYSVATKAMLSRVKRLSRQQAPQLAELLQRVFMAAHEHESRVIDSKLIGSAIGSDDAKWLEELVRQDRVPLLSLLQVDPLEMQAPHLSFQEYLVVCAICDGAQLPMKSIEQLSTFWVNTLRLGAGIGKKFGEALAMQLELTEMHRLEVCRPLDVKACCAALAAILSFNSTKLSEIR